MAAVGDQLADVKGGDAMKTHYRVCNFCEAMCGLEVTYRETRHPDESAIVVKPDKNDPFSKGSMCPKASVLR